MEIRKNLAIYILAFSILAASLIFVKTVNLRSNPTSPIQVESGYISESKYKEDMSVLLTELIELKKELAQMQGQITNVEECLRQTTINLTQNNSHIFICP